ncbi:MAG: HIT family protein [Thaumarchaeota archaeon 13_1_40CM_3_38_6]|nr:MAG: HIT family protein [Thaumarchaeota archaeon 13_1_40CM_3_38_6]
MDCIFCNIVSGKILARKIHETPRSLAFLDAFPLTKGHSLVIPKTHYVKIQEMTQDDNADLFESVRIISNRIERITPSSLVAIHNGKESGQEIPHVHVHIIPRNVSDGVGPVHNMFTKRPKLTDIEFNEIAEILRKQ